MSTLRIAPQAGDATLAEQWLAEAQREGRIDSFVGKRQETRYTWDAALEVHVLSPCGRGETYYATARDISTGGIGFNSRQDIPLYSQVRICLAGELTGVTAVVMHSTSVVTNHIIGAQFRFEEQFPAETQAVKVG